MSWCTAAEVVELIAVARLRGDVDGATRKSADLRFIDICTTAINAGDVLLQIALEATATEGLRLNAVFAAQPLLTTQGWVEGGQFSDRSAVTHLILRAVSDPAFDARTRLNKELLHCLALIVALEFPADVWQRWLQECAYSFVSGTGGHTAAATLHAVVAESYRSYPLWIFLANDLTSFLLQAGLTALPQRTEVLRVFLELMRKRPRPSAEHEVATGQSCLLLSATMRAFIMDALRTRVVEAQQAGSLSGDRVSDCTAAFAVASRLVVDAESAVTVFTSSSFFLAHLQDTAARGGLSDELTALTEQLLECLLSTLQLFPDVASSDVSADALLTCLIHFMILPEEPERADTAQLSAELLEFFMDDEAVPLGCGSGNVASLSGAVLELFLEHNPAQRPLAIATLNGMLRSTPEMSGALADAVALALRSVCRVYEAADAVLVDAVDSATQAELLGHVWQLLLATRDPHAHIMLIDALTHCFYRTRNEDLCRQLVQLLQHLYATAATEERECAVCVQCACVYAVGRLVEEVRGQRWRDSLLEPAWAGVVLELLSAGDTFGVFCAASTLCTLLSAVPDCVQHLVAQGGVWERGLLRLCSHATMRSVAVLLTLTLKHISGATAGAAVGPPTSLSPHNCGLVVTSCDVVVGFCQSPSPSRHLVLRSLVDFVTAHTRATLQSGGAAPCATCAPYTARLTAALLGSALVDELLQDEASCRALATLAAVQCVAYARQLPELCPVVSAALLQALKHAVVHAYSSQSISCVCAHLGLVVVLQPALIDGVLSAVLATVFAPNVDLVANRKGVHYGGLACLLSFFFMRHPHALFQVPTGHSTGSPAGASEHAQRAFGWWLSLAPFLDAVSLSYFVAACCRIVDAAATTAAAGHTAPATLPACRQFIFPSAHAKRLPARPCANAGTLQHLALALVDLERRYSRTNKTQLLDKELQPLLIPLEQHYGALCGTLFEGSTASAAAKATAAESIAAVIALVGRADGGVAIEDARQLLARYAA